MVGLSHAGAAATAGQAKNRKRTLREFSIRVVNWIGASANLEKVTKYSCPQLSRSNRIGQAVVGLCITGCVLRSVGLLVFVRHLTIQRPNYDDGGIGMSNTQRTVWSASWLAVGCLSRRRHHSRIYPNGKLGRREKHVGGIFPPPGGPTDERRRLVCGIPSTECS